jgi:hypothetical protein
MDRTLNAVRKMLEAVEAPKYDLGVLSDRGMLPGMSDLSRDQVISRLPLLKSHNARGAHIYIRPSGQHRFTVLDDLGQNALDRISGDGYEPCAAVETSPGNFQAWLKHDDVYPTGLSTFIAKNLAERYQGDLSAADWRRFGRLPGFTNCKPKYRRPDGLFPFVLLRDATGQPYSRAVFLRLEMTKQYQLREQERERRIAEYRQAALFDPHGRRFSHLSLNRFRLSPKYAGRPAAADIAFCVAAYSRGMPEDDVANTLAADYLSRDPNPRRKAAYIERTLAKARAWAQR